MAVTLLDGAGPNATGPEFNVRPVVRDCEPLHFFGTGTYDAAATIEGSPISEGSLWYTIGTIASGAEVVTNNPYERVRVRSGAQTPGTTATVYLVTDA